MSETITIYCKNNNTYKEVPIGSSLLDIYSLGWRTPPVTPDECAGK